MHRCRKALTSAAAACGAAAASLFERSRPDRRQPRLKKQDKFRGKERAQNTSTMKLSWFKCNSNKLTRIHVIVGEANAAAGAFNSGDRRLRRPLYFEIYRSCENVGTL